MVVYLCRSSLECRNLADTGNLVLPDTTAIVFMWLSVSRPSQCQNNQGRGGKFAFCPITLKENRT